MICYTYVQVYNWATHFLDIALELSIGCVPLGDQYLWQSFLMLSLCKYKKNTLCTWVWKTLSMFTNLLDPAYKSSSPWMLFWWCFSVQVECHAVSSLPNFQMLKGMQIQRQPDAVRVYITPQSPRVFEYNKHIKLFHCTACLCSLLAPYIVSGHSCQSLKN